MFEHMKNYELLMAKINNWIKPGGKVNTFLFLEYSIHLCVYLVSRDE